MSIEKDEQNGTHENIEKNLYNGVSDRKMKVITKANYLQISKECLGYMVH